MYNNTVDITFYTDDAHYLFMGGAITQDKQFIPSFFYTKRELDKLLPMAYKKNPFAVTGLKTIELLLDHINAITQKEIQCCKNLLDKKKEQGMHYRLIGKQEPYQAEINLVNHFTQLFITMLINSDQCFRYIRTANLALSVPDDEAAKKIRELRNKIRHLFERTVTYGKKIKPGITIQDVTEKAERSKSMIELFGIPHDKVLSGEIQYTTQHIGILGYK